MKKETKKSTATKKPIATKPEIKPERAVETAKGEEKNNGTNNIFSIIVGAISLLTLFFVLFADRFSLVTGNGWPTASGLICAGSPILVGLFFCMLAYEAISKSERGGKGKR